MSEWNHIQEIATRQWRCGYCDRDVASDRGWYASRFEVGGYDRPTGFVALCPRCDMPSVMGPEGPQTIPPSAFGEAIDHLPDDVATLYEEARRAISAGEPNCAALACRKVLMHVGVEKGAPEGGSFVSYVDHLANNGYVPPDARDWIDEIREHGNDANHEIDLITSEEAEVVVDFTAMLLRVIYEYPERGRQARAARQARRP